jgi:hypothetical protein
MRSGVRANRAILRRRCLKRAEHGGDAMRFSDARGLRYKPESRGDVR